MKYNHSFIFYRHLNIAFAEFRCKYCLCVHIFCLIYSENRHEPNNYIDENESKCLTDNEKIIKDIIE